MSEGGYTLPPIIEKHIREIFGSKLVLQTHFKRDKNGVYKRMSCTKPVKVIVQDSHLGFVPTGVVVNDKYVPVRSVDLDWNAPDELGILTLRILMHHVEIVVEERDALPTQPQEQTPSSEEG